MTCYIDKKMPDVLGDYVAAAPLNLTYKDQAWSCFARKNSELMQGSVTGRELKPGDTVEVCIKSNPDGYAVKLGDGEFLTGGFDFKLTAVDLSMYTQDSSFREMRMLHLRI